MNKDEREFFDKGLIYWMNIFPKGSQESVAKR